MWRHKENAQMLSGTGPPELQCFIYATNKKSFPNPSKFSLFPISLDPLMNIPIMFMRHQGNDDG